MPITQTLVIEITCDNPACPGNDLPTDDRMGWIIVRSEVVGTSAPVERVFCSVACVNAFQVEEPAAS